MKAEENVVVVPYCQACSQNIVLFSLFFGVTPFLKHKKRLAAIGTGCSATKRQKAVIPVVRGM